MANLPTIVQGNSFALAIPLKVYVIGEGEVVLVDYTPDEGDSITVQLRGNRRVYSYTPTTEGNVATIQLAGNELAGLYDTVVTIIKDDDTHLRAFKSGQLAIVESVDDMTEGVLADGIEAGAVYLDPQIFIRGEQGEDGRGIVSVTKTATSGLVDTYTITYTDGTTSTFTVANGAQGEPGTDGTDGVGIASIVETPTTESGGANIITVTLTDGRVATFTVTNGRDGVTPDLSNYATKADLDGKQDTLVSGTTIKTINSTSLLGSGNLALATAEALSNYCPIIEDTRSSAVAAITGVAPFSQLVDGQRIVLKLAYKTAANSALQLTLSNNSTTAAIPIYINYNNSLSRLGNGYCPAGTYLVLIYNETDDRWVEPSHDLNTVYSAITQAEIDAGTQTGTRVITPKLLRDNFALLPTLAEITATGDVSQALESGKFYRFGEVDSLTITLTAPSAGMGGYMGKFTASASWSALAIPATVDEAAGNDTIEGGKTYEFNILDNVIVLKEV